jgi:hypothetical protein
MSLSKNDASKNKTIIARSKIYGFYTGEKSEFSKQCFNITIASSTNKIPDLGLSS